MGCGRSRPRSPSLQTDHDAHKDNTDNKGNKEKKSSKDNRDNKDSRDNKDTKDVKNRDSKDYRDNRREGRKQTTNSATRHGSGATTNGGTGDVNRYDMHRGGVTNRMEGVARRDWQFDDTTDTPPETEVAVYRSSVPSSARASLNPAPNPPSPNRLHSNFSLLNGGSHTELGMSTTEQMQMETQATMADSVQTYAGPGKPFHVTSSQQEFFKMLDEKIEKGADYDSDDY